MGIIDSLFRKRIFKQLSHCDSIDPDIWFKVAGVFENAKLVYEGPTGPSARIALEWQLVRTVADMDGAVEQARATLGEGSEILDAYCLLVIHQNESLNHKIVEILSYPDRVIEWRMGSLFQKLSLRDFAIAHCQ